MGAMGCVYILAQDEGYHILPSLVAWTFVSDDDVNT